MGDYFKPWRRKIGVVTLVMATMLCVEWIRSLVVVDVFCLPVAKHTLMILVSRSRSVVLEIEPNKGIEMAPKYIQWAIGYTPANGVKDDSIHWLWKVCGFGRGDGTNNLNDWPPSFTPAAIWAVPYWSIVMPLTLLSAFLLLSKPCKSIEKKITKPIAEKVA